MVFYHFREALEFASDHPVVALFAKGFIAVDVFFVLSGFVIHLAYRGYVSSFGIDSSLRFVVSRVLRVYPLHVFTLLLCLLNVWLILNFSSQKHIGDRYSFEYLIASLLLVQNWGGFDYLGWNIPSWSISSEFLAYILYPLIGWLILRCFHARLSIFYFVLFFLASIAIVFDAVGARSIGDQIPRLGSLRCLFEFSIGVLLSELRLKWIDRSGSIERSVIGASLLFGTFLIFFKNVTTPIVVAGWSSLLIYYLTGENRSFLVKILSNRYLCYLGKISFSTYMIHFVIKDWLKFLVADISPTLFLIYVAAVFLASIVLFEFIEGPAQRFSRRFLKSGHA